MITEFLKKVPPVEDVSDVELRDIGDKILETSRKLTEEKEVTERELKDDIERQIFEKQNELFRLANQKFIDENMINAMRENQNFNLVFQTWLALKPLDINRKRHVFGLKGLPILTSSAIKQIMAGDVILDIETRTLIKKPLAIMPRFRTPPPAPRKKATRRRRKFKSPEEELLKV